MSESAEIAKRKAIQEAGRKYIVTKETAFNVFLGDVELAKEKWYEASDKAKLVYDEEIEKWAKNQVMESGNYPLYPYREGLIKGYKHARDQMQGNQREELIKAFDWATEEGNPYITKKHEKFTVKQMIDEYLQTNQ